MYSVRVFSCLFFAVLTKLSRRYLLISLSSSPTRTRFSCVDTTLLPTSSLVQKAKEVRNEKASCLNLTPSNNHSSYKSAVIYLFISLFILLAIFTSFLCFDK